MLNFQTRTEKRSAQVASAKLKSHGCDWEIDVYPRGDTKSSTEIEHMSCYLKYMSSESDKHIRFAFRIGDNKKTCSNIFKNHGWRWGWTDAFERKSILKNCLAKDGSLVIECDIQVATPRRIWNPQKLERNEALVELQIRVSNQMLKKLFNSLSTLNKSKGNEIDQMDLIDYPSCHSPESTPPQRSSPTIPGVFKLFRAPPVNDLFIR